MQQGSLTALLSKLVASIDDTTATGESLIQGLRGDIEPLVSADLQPGASATAPGISPSAPAIAIAPHNITLKSAFNTPAATDIVQQIPGVLSALQPPVPPAAAPVNNPPIVKAPLKGISILEALNPQNISAELAKWHLGFFTQEFISVFLSTDTVHPVMLLPVDVDLLSIPIVNTSLSITQGNVWILSSMFDVSAPAGSYTGLTVSGGTLSFDKHLPVTNKVINMSAGATCTVQLNLQQPVDNSTPPDNTGIDAKNANVALPAQFSFTFSTPALKITDVANASWDLYGSANTFQYNAAQPASYNASLNSILVPFSVSPASFTVSACNSPFFTIQGSAPIVDGCWELPVTVIDTTNPGTASGTGGLAVLCSPGLQVQWSGLNGGWINLELPFISAAPGVIGLVDFFAGNLYATQTFNLWSNENTGIFSTLDTSYGALFPLYYLCMQSGIEFLCNVASFTANIDRPVRVDDSPVEVNGTNGLIFMSYTATNKYFVLYDFNLLQENSATPGKPVTDVAPEALALTNALLTATPVIGVMLFGKLDTPENFKRAYLYLSFGLFYLIPSLPDPYASTFTKITRRGISDTGTGNAGITRSYPLSAVTDLLVGLVRWPVVTTPPSVPPAQPANVAFAIMPISDLVAGVTPSAAIAATPTGAAPALATDDSELSWQRTIDVFGKYDLAMLDVSTNADLMGVSFSTMNIEASTDDASYSIKPVSNAGDPGILQIVGMDLATPGKFVRAFTVPEITWEPTINLTPPAIATDPPFGWLMFGNDGGPTQLFNNSEAVVPVTPIDVSNFIVNTYNDNATAQQPLVTASIFTLPFGMRSFALFNNVGKFPTGYVPAGLDIAPQSFNITPTSPANAPQKIATGGLQIKATGKNDPTDKSGVSFEGFTLQLKNILDAGGNITNTSILGGSVDKIFNEQFEPQSAVRKDGVPLVRIDFSGYGASTFSNWVDPTASIAATSQAKFDIFIGRTSLEIIQVKSIIYPWCIKVVRTITMYRAGSALIYRTDSGWRAETDGVYDFSYKDKAGTLIANPYTFHPGAVKGVFSVTNIIENDLPQFDVPWVRAAGTTYIDPNTQIKATVPSGGLTENVIMQPVYFDADVQIDNVVKGATNGKVPSKKMLGYVQLSPRGEPISPELFAQLLNTQSGSLGGPVDCIVNIGQSGQKMRIHSVDVSSSLDPGNTTEPNVFVGTARGTVILPKDGTWSIVQHNQGTDVVLSIPNNAAVPLIREGVLKVDGTSAYPANKLRLADPIDLLQAPVAATNNYGLVQNTGTQKVMYQLPAYLQGTAELLSKDNKYPLAKFADAYHLLNSTSCFPNPGDLPDIDMSNYGIGIVQEGYKLLNNINPGQMLKQALPSPFYFVNTPDFKLYITYDASTPNLNYDLDSAAQQWTASAKSITLNADLGPFTPLLWVSGDFDSENDADTAFNTPKLTLTQQDGLDKIQDILEVLGDLADATGNYADLVKQAMSIAMGNDGDNYQYKFHADKEIPVVQFPPADLDGPTTPLRLSAGLKVGAYFNETVALTTDLSSMEPSAGAYFEFDGSIQVMCVSVGVGTVYAIGQVMVKMSADIKTGPVLDMKFGFGAEIMVGLPVVGNASVTIMAGVEIVLSSSDIKITAFLSFTGNADLLGGLVNITIYIEASGTIDKGSGGTTMTAEVTFAIDISIFLIINIDFSKSWSESKSIA